MNLAVKASHCARFYESVATSRLLQHVTETVDALSSVRTYGPTVSRAPSLRRPVSWSSVCTLLASTVFVGPDGPDPSSVGLALSSATSVPLALMTLCVMLFNVLQMIVSFERLRRVHRSPARGKSSTVFAHVDDRDNDNDDNDSVSPPRGHSVGHL
ncbi:hypothetical protein MRX96_004219 [Rhipicephalus microplus]